MRETRKVCGCRIKTRWEKQEDYSLMYDSRRCWEINRITDLISNEEDVIIKKYEIIRVFRIFLHFPCLSQNKLILFSSLLNQAADTSCSRISPCLLPIVVKTNSLFPFAGMGSIANSPFVHLLFMLIWYASGTRVSDSIEKKVS